MRRQHHLLVFQHFPYLMCSQCVATCSESKVPLNRFFAALRYPSSNFVHIGYKSLSSFVSLLSSLEIPCKGLEVVFINTASIRIHECHTALSMRNTLFSGLDKPLLDLGLDLQVKGNDLAVNIKPP